MKTFSFLAAFAATTLLATAAHAGACSPEEEGEAGKLAANATKAAVSKVVSVTGKQMVNIESCDIRAGNFDLTYKYNFIGADGLYWVSARAKLSSSGAGDVKILKTSPSIAAAEAKAGVKLAAN